MHRFPSTWTLLVVPAIACTTPQFSLPRIEDEQGGLAAADTGATEEDPNADTDDADDSPTTEPGCQEATPRAHEALTQACASCHGPDGSDQGGFGSVLDPQTMMTDGLLVADDASASRLFQRIESGDMPPGNPLDPQLQADIRAWIECGAEPFEQPLEATFISRQAEIEVIAEDLRSIEDLDQPEMRYFSMVHLYNAGVSAESLELYVQGLNKAILNTSRTIPDPYELEAIPLDPAWGVPPRYAEIGLIFRVSIDEYGWQAAHSNPDKWEEILKLYPYGMQYEGDAADTVVDRTRSRIPVIQGDWFVANATVPPLYYDLLDIPDTRDAFLEDFMPQGFMEDLEDGLVDCAGFQESGVSTSNRVVCRHDAAGAGGYCWLSYDFASSAGEQNIFANPTGFLDQADGGEIICSLRNGQQAYFIHDRHGNRIDEAPIDIVFDCNEDAAVVETGLSCIRCHSQGLIAKADEVAAVVDAYPTLYSHEERELVDDWFTPWSRLEGIYESDRERFLESVEALGVDAQAPVEPTWALASNHEDPLTVERAAAELGEEPAALEALMEVNLDVAVNFSGLADGGTVPREIFETVVKEVILCETGLAVGCEPAGCGVSGVECLDDQVCNTDGTCEDH